MTVTKLIPPPARNTIGMVRGVPIPMSKDWYKYLAQDLWSRANEIDFARFAAGIEPISVVSALPDPSGYAGPVSVFLTTDFKIYRYTGSAWTSEIDGADLTGTITETQIDDGSITTPKLAANAVTAQKINVSQLSAISATLGTVLAGLIVGVTIQTATSGQRVEIDGGGITLKSGSPSAPYNTSSTKYNDSSNKYGSGTVVAVNNSAYGPPFYVVSEQAVADFHMYNRGSDPTGAAEVGDLCVVNGKLKVCTSAGTPGTWTVVGTQT